MEMIGKTNVVDANGTSVAWGELGSGEPVVMLHGLCDSHRTWRRAAPILARHHRVLMPDLPGHGLSGRPDAPYSLEWYARTLVAWMSAIGLERAHVVGHSFGGGVAQWLLLEQRARIDRLALVAPGGLGREVGWGLRLAAFPVLGPMVAPPLVALAAPWAMRLDPKSFARPEPVEIAHAAWTIRAPLTGRAFRRTVHGCIDLFGQHMQAWQRVHEVESLPPLALFWGESDPVIPARHGRRASERLPGATLTLYPGCGHFPHLEAHERFAADLDRFLDDRERARARVRKRPATRRRSGVWAAVRRWLARAAGALRRGLRALNEELVAPGRDQASGVRRQASGTARSLIPRPPAPAS